MLEFLTEAEQRQFARPAMHNKLAVLYAQLPPVNEFVAAAIAGAAKRGWYKQARGAITERFPNGALNFTALLAALSPRVSVAVNVRNAIAVYELWRARGCPTDKRAILAVLRDAIPGQLLQAWINNAVTALRANGTTPLLSGPKVNSFMRNLLGNVHEVTIDAWMMTFAGIDGTAAGTRTNMPCTANNGPGKTPTYVAMAAKVRAAAKALGWTPCEVQETIWSFTKTAFEYASAQGLTVAQLVDGDIIMDKIVAGAADFHTLIGAADSARKYRTARKATRSHLLAVAARIDAKLTAARAAGDEPNF